MEISRSWDIVARKRGYFGPDEGLEVEDVQIGDHPTLGTPSWYFHPCHTADVVGEVLAEIEVDRADELRWLEVWFMVMGNMVDLFAGSVA